jgi:hypothetical protein
VRVGPREGVCRDFAVLGYCEKGLDCEQQHVRECPDFAEKGVCTTKGCKLPHVIRANRTRPKGNTVTSASKTETSVTAGVVDTIPVQADAIDRLYAEDAQLGDEYISLTFHESESEDENENEEEEEEDEEEEDVEEEAGGQSE